MRSRQFKKKTQDPSNSDNSLWTETPAEREERLKKQVLSNLSEFLFILLIR